MLDITNVVTNVEVVAGTGFERLLEELSEKGIDTERVELINMEMEGELEYSHYIDFELASGEDTSYPFAVRLYFDVDALKKLKEQLDRVNLT